MRDHGPRGREPSTTEDWPDLDELTRFEVWWRDGDRGAIERLLVGLEPPRIPGILRLLVKAEIRLRREAGERPADLEYLGRFPEHVDLIASIFEGWDDAWLIDGPGETIPGADPTRDAGASDPHAPTRLERPTTHDGGGAAGRRSDGPAGPGAQESRYRVDKFYKRGGMGEIWHAYDLELKRDVAVKIIREEYAGIAEIRERFNLESEVIGKLEHPNVIPIYGKGVARDGRPSYAMPFIDGETLRDAIDRFHKGKGGRSRGEHELMFRSLIRRIVDVCNAIEHAHSRGVLHRDIKPLNVMLGRFGETLVLDWGLAKDLDHKSGIDALDLSHWSRSGAGVDQTLLTKIEGTMRYMSPEQALGKIDRIGKASDVFNLGATFYYLLTGRAPYSSPYTDALREQVIRCDYPPPRKGRRDLPAALESICLKAMDREPERRYPSARSLADDLERWLGDEPVKAHKYSRLTRASRWARRHRSQVAVAVILLVGLLIATLSIVEARVQKRRAAENFTLANDAVNQMLLRVSEKRLFSVAGMSGLRKELGDDAVRFLKKLLDRDPDDPALRLNYADTCLNAANNHFQAASLDRFLLYYDEDILPIYQRLRSDNLANVWYRHAVAFCMVIKSQGLRELGRVAEAIKLLREAEVEELTVLRNSVGLPATDANLAKYRYGSAQAQVRLAETLLLVAGYQEAQSLLEPAIESLTIQLKAKPADFLLQRELSDAWTFRGVVASETRDLDGASRAFDRGNRLLDEASKGTEAAKTELDYLRAMLLGEHGHWLASLPGRAEDAERVLDRAVLIMVDLCRDYAEIPEYRCELSWSLINRGLARSKLEDARRTTAEADLAKAVEILERLARENPTLVRAHSLLGRAQGSLGRSLLGRGDREHARPLLKAGIESLSGCLRKNAASPRDNRAMAEHRKTLGEIDDTQR